MAALSSSLNDLSAIGASLCRAAMKRCANLVWAHRLAQWTISAADTTRYTAFLQYSCLRRADGTLCPAVMTSITNASFTASETGLACTASSVTGQCKTPSQCQTWTPATSCVYGCATAVESLVRSFGCCFKSTKQLYLDVLNTPSGLSTPALSFFLP
jgi:hypothetical protein